MEGTTESSWGTENEDASQPTWDQSTTTMEPSWTTTISTTSMPSWDTTTPTTQKPITMGPSWDLTTKGQSDMPPLVRCESKRDCKGQKRLDLQPSRPMKHCDMGSKKASSSYNKKGICSDRNKCDTDEDCINFGGEAVMVCKKMRYRKSVCRWTGEIDKQPEPTGKQYSRTQGSKQYLEEQTAETGEPQNTLMLCKHKGDCSSAQRCLSANGYGEYDNSCVAMKHCDKGPKRLYKEEGVCTDRQKCKKDSDCGEIGNPTDGIAGMKCKKMKSTTRRKRVKISRHCRWTGEVEEEELSPTLPLIKCKRRRDCKYECKKNDDCEGMVHCDKGVCNDRQECKTDDDCGNIGDIQTTGAAERFCLGAKKSRWSRCMMRGGIKIA